MHTQGRLPANLDKSTVKALVQQQVQALKPIRAPWYRPGPGQFARAALQDVPPGTGAYCPSYAQVGSSSQLVSIITMSDNKQRGTSV